MWYTTRHEGLDEPKHTQRMPTQFFSSSTEVMLSGILRAGLFLEFMSLTGYLLSYYIFKGHFLFTYDLMWTTPEMRADKGFQVALVVCSLMKILGALFITGFTVFLADDACWARGYRAGSKLLSIGAPINVLSAIVQLVFYLSLALNYDATWWAHFQQGGAEWIFLTFARILHAIALLYFADGFALLELYHDQGTNDWHGVLNAFLFAAAAIGEILVVFLTHGAAAVFITWIALLSAMVWAMGFEQEVNETSPSLNETELTNEIEQQVEKFARMSPFLGMGPQGETA